MDDRWLRDEQGSNLLQPQANLSCPVNWLGMLNAAGKPAPSVMIPPFVVKEALRSI